MFSVTEGNGDPRDPIAADDKDWTWVLNRTCPECRFDVHSFPREDIGRLLRENAATWRQILGGEPARLRRRPLAHRWSALEYACHVRDVFRVFSERLDLMLTGDGPHYPNWDQDATAIDDRYDEADPAGVAAGLAEAADELAARFDAVTGEAWQRWYG